MSRILSTLCLIAIGACAPDVPATPSFQQDVMPILAANCIRCHSTPTIGGALEGFRLDAFADVIVTEPLFPGEPMCAPPSPSPFCFSLNGAASMADSSASRVGDDDRPMPPRFQLDDHQIELLENWAATGAGRGEPRPDNGRPTAAVETIARTGTVVRLQVRVDDPDRDVVGGSLHARIGSTDTFVGLVQSGIATVTWDTTGIPAGSYPLSARLDDGAAEILVSLGTITVGGP